MKNARRLLYICKNTQQLLWFSLLPCFLHLFQVRSHLNRSLAETFSQSLVLLMGGSGSRTDGSSVSIHPGDPCNHPSTPVTIQCGSRERHFTEAKSDISCSHSRPCPRSFFPRGSAILVTTLDPKIFCRTHNPKYRSNGVSER